MSKPLLTFACLGPVIGGVAAIFESNWTTLAWTLITLLWIFNMHKASTLARKHEETAERFRKAHDAAHVAAVAWRDYASALETSLALCREDNPSQGGTE